MLSLIIFLIVVHYLKSKLITTYHISGNAYISLLLLIYFIHLTVFDPEISGILKRNKYNNILLVICLILYIVYRFIEPYKFYDEYSGKIKIDPKNHKRDLEISNSYIKVADISLVITILSIVTYQKHFWLFSYKFPFLKIFTKS